MEGHRSKPPRSDAPPSAGALTPPGEANREIDEILGVLAHELRTPLQAILTWADVLRQQPADGRVLARAADVVERSARAQMRLINDLLDIGRLARGQLRLERQRVQMTAVVRLALDSVRATAAARRIALIFDVPDGPCRVDGDATRLQQVVWHLLSNAIAFTPAGGRVEVSLALERGEVVLRVRDDGPGFPAAVLPHVFERFRQADRGAARLHGGLGLGLALVRHLVALHDGAVEAANASGGGALCTVRLPASSS